MFLPEIRRLLAATTEDTTEAKTVRLLKFPIGGGSPSHPARRRRAMKPGAAPHDIKHSNVTRFA